MIVQNVSGKEVKIIELRKVIPANRGYYRLPYPIAYKYRKYLKPIQLKDEFIEDIKIEEGVDVITPPQVNINRHNKTDEVDNPIVDIPSVTKGKDKTEEVKKVEDKKTEEVVDVTPKATDVVKETEEVKVVEEAPKVDEKTPKTKSKPKVKAKEDKTDEAKAETPKKKKRGRPKKAALADKKEEVTTDKVDEKTEESK